MKKKEKENDIRAYVQENKCNKMWTHD